MGQSFYGRRKPAVVHSWPKKLHVLRTGARWSPSAILIMGASTDAG